MTCWAGLEDSLLARSRSLESDCLKARRISGNLHRARKRVWHGCQRSFLRNAKGLHDGGGG